MRHSMQHRFVLRLRKHVGMQCDSSLEHFHPSMGSECEMVVAYRFSKNRQDESEDGRRAFGKETKQQFGVIILSVSKRNVHL